DIAVTVHDLIHGVALLEQLLAMHGGGAAAFHRGRRLARGPESPIAVQPRAFLLAAKRPDKLLEEQRHTVLELGEGHRRRVPPADLRAATPDQLVSVGTQKFVQHDHCSYEVSAVAAAPRLDGSVNRKVEPLPSLLSTLTLPSWASTKVLTMARPRPQPPSFAGSVSALSNTFSRRSGAIPAPLSLTQHSKPPCAPERCAPMTTSPRGVYAMALAITFWNTRLNKPASA